MSPESTVTVAEVVSMYTSEDPETDQAGLGLAGRLQGRAPNLMGGWGNRVSFPDPELGSGRPGEAGVGCSFRRLFHVVVGKTRKARQRAPL